MFPALKVFVEVNVTVPPSEDAHNTLKGEPVTVPVVMVLVTIPQVTTTSSKYHVLKDDENLKITPVKFDKSTPPTLVRLTVSVPPALLTLNE